MDLVTTIKGIQEAVGAKADGVFGPQTAGRVLAALLDSKALPSPPVPKETVISTGDGTIANLDARTVKNIGTLDAKARDRFVRFSLLANATAATYGCSYVIIGGNRTWAEQDVLYAQGRTAGGKIVTNARGGQSNHNFGIAGDYGVFKDGKYLDDSNPGMAEKVHKACSLHAEACGLEWGGSWKSITDQPHYQVPVDLTLAQMRALFAAKGSVL